jgi:uncharacterized membrane protein
MTDEKNNTSSSSGTGFGGFGDLVSDVSKDIESATRESSNTPTHQPKATAPSTSNTQHTTAQTEVPQGNKPPVSPLPPSSSSGAKWFWGIGIVMVVLIGIGIYGKKENPSYSPSPTNSPPPTYTPAAIPVPASDMPPASVYSPVLPREDKPPIGNGLALSRDQIRYCLSQKIRIDSIDKIVNTSLSGEVDSFNALVGDYNSRCSHFKYRRGSLEGVPTEVDGERFNIEAAAQSKWVRESLGLGSSLENVNKPSPKATHNRKKTVREKNIADNELEPSRSPVSQPSLPVDNGKTSAPGRAGGIPANSKIDYTGHAWTCIDGYRQVGNECRIVERPANSKIDYTGHAWTCIDGYRQVGNECSPI